MKRNQAIDAIAIGGGAAGYFGAIACARAHPRRRVRVLEATGEVLKKVRISGGGRCNVTHACYEPAQLIQNYPRGSKALRGAFSRFQPSDTVAWFESRGVRLKTEADGRMFPTTDDSETIASCLIDSARMAGVNVSTHAAVKAVVKSGGRFQVHLKTGEALSCCALLLATGSHPSGYAIARSLGHTVRSPVPSLFTFTIRDRELTELAGASAAEVKLTLKTGDRHKLEQVGPLLVTHWGVSGPAVLKLSAWGARELYDCRYQATLMANWLPFWNQDEVRQALLAIARRHPKKSIGTSWLGEHRRAVENLPKRVWRYVVQVQAQIELGKRWTEISKKEMNRLVGALVRSQWHIVGKGVFKDEFVTCGGILLKEVDMKTMQSRLCPGLYFAGEVLDVDGITGGFNFQNAWTTSWLAGHAIAVSLDEK